MAAAASCRSTRRLEAGAIRKRYGVKRSDGHLTEVYGLITRVRGDGDGRRVNLYLILSGVSSAGILAAAEYAASPYHLQHLIQSLATGWQTRAVQVLIRVRASLTLPLSLSTSPISWPGPLHRSDSRRSQRWATGTRVPDNAKLPEHFEFSALLQSLRDGSI